jgi:hypothetical protein
LRLFLGHASPFREATPIELHVDQGSFSLGSDATPMVVIGNFTRARGTIETSDSRSRLDEYKTSYDLQFEDTTVLMRTNVDYSGPLLNHGKKAYDELVKQKCGIGTFADTDLISPNIHLQLFLHSQDSPHWPKHSSF